MHTNIDGEPTTPTNDIPMVKVPRSAQPVPTRPKLASVRFPLLAYMATAAVLIPVLIFGSVQMGWFGTTGRVDASTGLAITLSADSSSEDIRGWMTMQQVLDGFGISRAEFEVEFPLPAGTDMEAKIGETSEAAGFELEAVRAWIDARQGGATASTPAEATAEATTSAATPTATPTHTPTGTPTGAADGSEDGAPQIRGRTTVGELLDSASVSLSTFTTTFNLPIATDLGAQLSELVDRNGDDVSVDEIRTWAAGR